MVTARQTPPTDPQDPDNEPAAPVDPINRIIGLMKAADDADLRGTAHYATAGEYFTRASQARGTVANQIGVTHQFGPRINVASPVFGNQPATPPPVAPQQGVQGVAPTQQQPAVPRNADRAPRFTRRHSRNLGFALLFGVVGFVGTLIIWSAFIVDNSKGNHNWSHNGLLEFLAAVLVGLGVAFFVASFGPDDEPEEEAAPANINVMLAPQQQPAPQQDPRVWVPQYNTWYNQQDGTYWHSQSQTWQQYPPQ